MDMLFRFLRLGFLGFLASKKRRILKRREILDQNARRLMFLFDGDAFFVGRLRCLHRDVNFRRCFLIIQIGIRQIPVLILHLDQVPHVLHRFLLLIRRGSAHIIRYGSAHKNIV